jgi:phage protein D
LRSSNGTCKLELSSMSATSLVRRPRLQVLANGTPVAGVRSADVSSCGYYAADRFSVSIALGADPIWTADYWSSQSEVRIEVQVGFIPDGAPEGAANWASIITGLTDSVQIELPAQIVNLHGRDLTAALISARTQETFANQTSSEIASDLARRHNLSPQVTATSTLVGTYYELERDRITLNQFSRVTTEWDLLIYLAQRERFDVYVQGEALYFQPSPPASRAPDMTLRPIANADGPANIMEFRMERALALAGNVEVTVKSWNSRQQYANTHTVSSSQSVAASQIQSYIVVQPNLSPDQAVRLAQNWLEMLSQHERVITAVMPGELTLTPRSLVGVEGTNTAFDQSYLVEAIDRRIRCDRGFIQNVRAKSASLSAG